MMKKKKNVLGIGVFLTVILILLMVTETRTQAQGQGETADISKKLDSIIENQKTILQGINSLKAELNIVKIRVTQQQ